MCGDRSDIILLGRERQPWLYVCRSLLSRSRPGENRQIVPIRGHFRRIDFKLSTLVTADRVSSESGRHYYLSRARSGTGCFVLQVADPPLVAGVIGSESGSITTRVGWLWNCPACRVCSKFISLLSRSRPGENRQVVPIRGHFRRVDSSFRRW